MSDAVESSQKIQTKTVDKNVIAILGISIPESTNFGVIFFMHAAKLLDFLFGTAMRYIIFPSAAIYGMTKAGLAWRMLKLQRNTDGKIDWKNWENWKDLSLTIWETINATATTAAVVLGTTAAIIGVSAALSALIGLSISAIFTAALGATTLIHAFFTGFHCYKLYAAKKEFLHKKNEIEMNQADTFDEKTIKLTALQEEYQKQKELHQGQIKHHAIVTTIVGLLTTSVVLAMIVGFPVIGGAIGMATCLGSVGYSAYNLYKINKTKTTTTEPASTSTDKPRLSSVASLRQGLSNSHSSKNDPELEKLSAPQLNRNSINDDREEERHPLIHKSGLSPRRRSF